MDENSLSRRIIGICIDVHRLLGPGLLESVYEEALAYELREAKIRFERQKSIDVCYRSAKVAPGFRVDFIVADMLLVEIKSVEVLKPVHLKQVLTYLKLTDLHLGLLINFNAALLKNGIKRIVNNLPE